MNITPQTKLKDLTEIIGKSGDILLLRSVEEKFTRMNDYIRVYPDWTVQELANSVKYVDYVLDLNKEIIFDSRHSLANTSSATPLQTSQ